MRNGTLRFQQYNILLSIHTEGLWRHLIGFGSHKLCMTILEGDLWAKCISSLRFGIELFLFTVYEIVI